MKATYDEQVESPEPKSLWNINFISVLGLGFVVGLANYMVNPILAKYSISLGATLTFAGTIVGLQSGMAMFLRPLSGAASDLLNRKFVMIGSALLTAFCLLGYFLFHNITAVFIIRIIQGFSYSFMSVARTAYATEYMPKNRIGEGIAYNTYGTVLSQALGPNLGLWISEKWGYNNCFLIALILCFAASFVLMPRPYKHKKGAFKKDKIKLSNLIAVEILPYGFLAGLFSIITQMGNAFVALIGLERGIANVGLFFTTYSVFALILRPLSGKAMDKFGLHVLLFPAFVFASLTMVLLGSANSILLIVLAGFTKSLSQGVAVPCINGASIKRSGKERAGVVSATIHMAQDLLNSLAPPVGGLLATQFGYRNMFYIFAGLMLLGIPAYMHLHRKEGRVKEEPAAKL